jgi:hypothetical protein
MNGYETLEDDLDALDYESDDSEFDGEVVALLEEDAEARRRRRRPVRTGGGAGYYRPRPTTSNVTQVQLQTALNKISKDVKANAAGIKTVGARVDTVAAAQTRQAQALKKESAQRKAEIAKVKNSLQMAALLPLITSKTVTTTGAVDGVPSGTRLMVAPDTMAMLLPMMLMGDGLGGGSGGDGMNMLFLAMAVSGGLK